MARKPNYGFNKNIKAQKRAEKQEAKRQRKLEARQNAREPDVNSANDTVPHSEPAPNED